MQSNGIQIDNTPNIIVITDSDQNQITVTQPIVRVIEVNNPGPQGQPGVTGPAGPSGSLQPHNTGSFGITGSLIITGSNPLTVIGPTILSGSLNVTQGITGSLFGTASYSTNALSASYALTASYASNVPITASYALTASVAVSSSYSLTASYVNPLKQTVIITGSLTVSGSSTFTNIGPAIFSGSVNITGSTVALQGGSFSGSGAELFNIPASGITGLNLSQIATGSVTASVSLGTGSFTINSGSSNFLFVSSSGNIGIGTTTPSRLLHVNEGGTRLYQTFKPGVPTLYVYHGRTENDSTVRFENGSGDNLYFGGNGLFVTGNTNIGSGTTLLGARLGVRGSGTTSSTTALLVQNSNASSSLAVLDNGNVGIGTTTPTYPLSVQGMSYFNTNTSSTNSILRLTDNTNGTAWLGFSSTTATGFFIGGNGGMTLGKITADNSNPSAVHSQIVLNQSGNPGIQLSTNVANTGIVFSDAVNATIRMNFPSTSEAAITTISSHNLSIGVASSVGSLSSTTMKFFQSTGNISIGNTTDLARLSVKGSGTTSSTTAFLVQNANASQSLKVFDDGGIQFGNTSNSVNFDFYGYNVVGLRLVDTANSRTLTFYKNGGNNYIIDTNSDTRLAYGWSGNYFWKLNGGTKSMAISSTTSDPDAHASAIVDFQSTTKGFLPPRTNVTSNISAPAQGLMTYVTASATEGLYYYNSGSYQGWTRLLNNSGSQVISGSLELTSALTASNAIISGNVTVLGTASINTLIVNQTQLSTGSNQLGDAADDFQTLYGTVRIPTGSLTVTGSIISTDYIQPQYIASSASVVVMKNIAGPSYITDLSTGGAGDLRFYYGGGGGWSYNWYTDNTHRVRISDGGMGIGVGNTNPSARLHVKGSGATSSTTTLLVQNANASSSLVVLDNGNVYSNGPGFIASNTAFGFQSLNNPSGSATQNAAFGYQNFVANNYAGYDNVAIGFRAIQNATTGYQNMGIGTETLQNLTVGSANTAVGHSVLRFATANTSNTGIGYYSLYTLGANQGNSNTGIGGYAFQAMTTGSSNIGIGAGSSTFKSGSFNIFIGAASTQIITGSGNVIIGNNQTLLSSSLDNTIAISDGSGNMRIYVSSSGNVGIGTTTPNARLDVSGSLNISGSGTQVPFQITSGSTSLLFVSGSGNVGIGTISPVGKLDVVGSLVTTRILSNGSLSLIGTDITAGAQTILTLSTGVNNATGPNIILSKARGQSNEALSTGDVLGTIQFQGANGTTSVESSRIQSVSTSGFSVSSRASSLLFFTTAIGSTTVTERMRINSEGSVGIGTTTPLARLHTVGTGVTSATTTFLLQNSTPTTLMTVLDNGQFTYTTPTMTLAASQSAYVISPIITASNAVGGTYYAVNITPTFYQTTASQTETAFRVAATFTASSAAATSGSNIIADFGATSVGSQLTVTDITSGSIYMVNDVSGLPIIEATSDWTVNMYNFPNLVFQKTGSQVNINGTLRVSGSFILPLSQSVSPQTGSAYWSGSLLFVYDGTRYRSSSFA
jgi:hypothetical protein